MNDWQSSDYMNDWRSFEHRSGWHSSEHRNDLHSSDHKNVWRSSEHRNDWHSSDHKNGWRQSNYEGWSKSSFLFLIQRKVRILSKFCDVHIKIKYIISNWMLFEKHLWRHSLWHVTSRDISKGVIVVSRFSRVASAKFEIFFRSKKHSIPLRNAHLKLIATDPNTI